MNRRRFLILSSQAGLSAALTQLLPLPVWAAGRQDRVRHLITVHFTGGWDVILGLDPKVKNASISDQACFIGYRPEEIIQAGGLNLGPAAAGLAPYADRCIVINGVSMLGNISHEDCARMAQTGVIDRRTPQLVSLKAYVDRQGEDPQVLANNGSRLENGGLEVNAVSPEDVANLISGGNGSREIFLESDGLMARDQNSQARFGEVLRQLVAANPELKAKFEDTGNNGNGGFQSLSTKNAASIVLALKAGFVSGAHINLSAQNAGLDTHSSHKANHVTAQKECFDQLLQLVELLKAVPGSSEGLSMFDETLIVATSEFSRESAMNGPSVDSAGKEHNGYTNSYLLMGGRLRGGRTIGESVLQYGIMGKPSMHTARNFDFTCGQPIRTRADAPDFLASNYFKKQIQPGHVIRTLADALGARDLLDPAMRDYPWLPLSI